MRRLFLSLVFLGLSASLAVPQPSWREFSSDSDGFSIQLPATPKISSHRVGDSEMTQTNFLIDRGEHVYFVSVLQLPAGAGNKFRNEASLTKLLEDYAAGSKTTTRSSRSITLVGQP